MGPECFVFCLSFCFLMALEHGARPHAIDGLYFQKYTSDRMMQTLPCAILRERPWQALFYLHIQPPMLDAIRALLAQFADSLRALDSVLYVVWGLIYACIATLIFHWIARLATRRWAAFAVLAWCLHPAALFCATLLDSTQLSGLLVFWLLFELWRAKTSRRLGPFRLSLAVACVFLTRTVFQWYCLPVLALALLLMGFRLRRVFLSLSLCAVVVLLLVTKQYVLYRTLSTSTFSGYHYCGLFWYKPSEAELNGARAALAPVYPEGAEPVSAQYNTADVFADNLVYTKACRDAIAANPGMLFRIARSIRQNVRVFFWPTVWAGRNAITDRLPWRWLYDRVFGGVGYVLLVAFVCLVWVRDKRRRSLPVLSRAELGLLVPVAYTFTIVNLGNRYDWVESHRLKFLLEPAFFVFLVCRIRSLCSVRMRRG